jgi:CBS domain-containing protein
MRDRDIGDVLVVDDGSIRGIVTDRDIVVRCVADGADLENAKVGDVCSADLTTVTADATVEEAARIMRDSALRRLPVVDRGAPVGIVTLGDLAVQADPHSALGGISAARPNG